MCQDVTVMASCATALRWPTHSIDASDTVILRLSKSSCSRSMSSVSLRSLSSAIDCFLLLLVPPSIFALCDYRGGRCDIAGTGVGDRSSGSVILVFQDLSAVHYCCSARSLLYAVTDVVDRLQQCREILLARRSRCCRPDLARLKGTSWS